jgi:hypothetical protein
MLTQSTHQKTLPARIITLVDEEESSKQINFACPSDRKWFMNHMYWALHNNAKVGIEKA